MTSKHCIFIGLLFFGCSSLHKQSSKSKVKSTVEVQQKNDQFLVYRSALLSIDSNSAMDEVLIWPKGIVKYATATGFEGEVLQIRLRSKNQRKQVQIQSQQNMVVHQTDLKAKLAERTINEAAEKVKVSTRFYAFGIVVLALLGIFIYVIYKGKFG